MVIDELLIALKQYLRIPNTDTEEEEYLKSFCEGAAGYISSQYRYNILDTQVVSKKMLTASRRNKIYLPEAPVIEDTVTVIRPDGTPEPTTFNIMDATLIFDEPILYEYGIFKFSYTSGVLNTPEFQGDIEHCVQLAAWLYRTADKGLEGVDQISTGVKESTKMFSGIPRNITAYFETRQPIRL